MGTPVMNRSAAMKRAHLMREILETLLFVALVFVIVHFAIQPYRISDVNMKPQLNPDQLVVVNKWAYLLGGPGRGDVVVYYDPTNLSQQLVARVLAVPGDTVRVTPASIIVDGVTLNEPYAQVPEGTAPNARIITDLKLGNNQYFIVNDSRLVGSDSRSFGAVSRGNIVGKAVLVFWPLSSFTGISTYPDVFSHVGK
ncbi:MAG TPA: signal peptidase I [Ktedonobacterales bacterium]